jgi:hypothetical protein
MGTPIVLLWWRDKLGLNQGRSLGRCSGPIFILLAEPLIYGIACSVKVAGRKPSARRLRDIRRNQTSRDRPEDAASDQAASAKAAPAKAAPGKAMASKAMTGEPMPCEAASKPASHMGICWGVVTRCERKARGKNSD